MLKQRDGLNLDSGQGVVVGAQFNLKYLRKESGLVVMISQSGGGWTFYLFQIEFVAEHPLTVLTHPRLSALPAGTQQSCHLV